jgi:site-specific DNA recombinase
MSGPQAIVLPVANDGVKLRPMVGAVIYVRVSDPRQVVNLSLGTQLRACDEYCVREGFQVLERFTEEGESAKTTDRTELQRLLHFCRTNKGKVHFVVVYSLSRFAREKFDHFALRAHLKSLGISLRSATEPIDDTATGKLMEGVLAAFAQFDNDVRSDRSRVGMRTALEAGRWTFRAPLGYLSSTRRGEKSLVPDPERAALIQRAFELFATGRYSQQQVLDDVTSRGLRGRHGRPLVKQMMHSILRSPMYIGLMNAPKFGVIGKRGDFDPLVSEKTFYRVQGILTGRVGATGPRLRNKPDFPLRAFVRCETCGRGLTSSWSKSGTGKKYPYYHCRSGFCRAVNVNKTTLEGLFAEELERLQPTATYMRLVKDAVLRVWQEERAAVAQQLALSKKRVEGIQTKLDRLSEAFLFDRTIDIDTYDRQRDRLHAELTLARMDHHETDLDDLDVEGILAFAERVLPRASDLWVQASLEQRQCLQKLFFPEGITFDGKGFVRTNVTASAFSYLGDISDGGSKMVGPPGFEPGTGRL